MKREHPYKVDVALQLNGAPGRNELMGVIQYLQRGGRWDLRLPQTSAQLNTDLKAGAVDGVIVGLLHDDETLKLLAKSLIPAVLLDIGADRVRDRRHAIAYIRNDDIGIGRLAAEHLASLGDFRSFAYVANSLPRPWCRLREKAFCGALERRGHTARVFRPFAAKDLEALSRFLSDLPKPAAVFAAYDVRAQDVLEAARRARIAIPAQLAVLGVDNDEIICENAEPQLSSIRPDHLREGFVAAQILDRLMGGARPPLAAREILQHIPVTDVVTRASTQRVAVGENIVRRARAFIQSEVARPVTPDDVARHLRISRRLLDKSFQTFSHDTPAALIRTLRLRELQRRLKASPSRSISAILSELGYPNPRQAENLFKRLTGQTMREFRVLVQCGCQRGK